MADLATIEWVQDGEPWDADNHPDGNEDVFNRANRVIRDVIAEEHNDDGTHKTDTSAEISQDDYTGNGADDRTISITPNNRLILFMFALSRAASPVVCKTSAMDLVGDVTKSIGTASFQTNMLQTVSNMGEFTVGTDVSVNDSGVVFDYLCFMW